MHENTHQQSTKPQSLESNEKMKGLMPPTFGFAGGEADGNVVPNVKYGSRIRYNEGEVEGAFGITFPEVVAENINVVNVDGKYHLNADLICWPDVTVWPGDQCLGRYTNIEDADSPKIGAQNYRAVARDLTPHANGRTYPSSFWSKPLVLKHENFHAQEMIKLGEEKMEGIDRSLSGKTIHNEGEGITLLEEKSADLRDEIDSIMQAKDSETPAYMSVAPEYQSLATTILKKGNAGGYK